jgi:hypothetical protein
MCIQCLGHFVLSFNKSSFKMVIRFSVNEMYYINRLLKDPHIPGKNLIPNILFFLNTAKFAVLIFISRILAPMMKSDTR